jgi:hypothetical protein
MQTMRSLCLTLMTVVLACGIAFGDAQSHRKAAETLLSVLETEKLLQRLAEEVVAAQIQQNPQLGSHRDLLQQFVQKYLNWDSIKGEMITVYTQEFTEKEIKQLTEFYKTPLGKKASDKMPKLTFLAGQLGLKRAQENQAELRQMIEERNKQRGG